jgi:SAM-dependent methyltransferase
MEGGEVESRRLTDFCRFVVSQLPPPPSRILEVGCGTGELALALARAGYAVRAIDPEAPEGVIFRRATLEEFVDDAEFEAVIASVSLHHVSAVGEAFDKIVSLLAPGGLLILAEFAKERFSGRTAEWYFHQRRALAAVGLAEAPQEEDFAAWLSGWELEHADIHPFAELRGELDVRFAERHFGWTPYLFDYWLDDALEPLERDLIERGAIDATGVRWVGERIRTSGGLVTR